MINYLENIEDIKDYLNNGNTLILFDKNTYEIFNQLINLRNLGSRNLILSSDIHADEKQIGRVFFEVYENEADLILSVGSGTLTDIARYVSAKSNIKFYSFPTAPSMDGYASSVAALTIDGIKTTVPAKAPDKIFIYLPILKQSPIELKRAGFGDLIGKITALLDWRISNILIDEKIDEDIYSEMKQAYIDTLHAFNSDNFEKKLIDGLIKSGLLMKKMGNSRPASGSEHHISHYLEYMGYDYIYHGIKVGIATLIILRLYENLMNLSTNEIKRQLEYRIDIERWKENIKCVYPLNYDKIISNNIKRIEKYNDKHFRVWIIDRIIENKKLIDDIIYESLKIIPNIQKAFKELNFDIEKYNIKNDDLINAILFADNIRDRFTILQLYELLGFLNRDFLNLNNIILN